MANNKKPINLGGLNTFRTELVKEVDAKLSEAGVTTEYATDDEIRALFNNAPTNEPNEGEPTE